MTKKVAAKIPFWDKCIEYMRIIALSTLKAFWEEKPEYLDAREQTLAWHRHALHAD